MRLTLLLATASALRAPVSRRHALFGGAPPSSPCRAPPRPSSRVGAAARTKGGAQKRTCRDIDECEALGEKRTAEQFGEEMPFSTTAEGVRWRDRDRRHAARGRRRLFVVPEKGWKKINSSCSAESNGASNAGTPAGLADIAGQAIVPLAQMVDNGACIEDALLPQPANFGAKRRLARRFDEGLLLEVGCWRSKLELCPWYVSDAS
ncbi:hypothetical protein JL722_12290 [Aureococcus anophagefferens]|nr:hypothetical protein JL722_12290 [Aureococcus anophagefferens]